MLRFAPLRIAEQQNCKSHITRKSIDLTQIVFGDKINLKMHQFLLQKYITKHFLRILGDLKQAI